MTDRTTTYTSENLTVTLKQKDRQTVVGSVEEPTGTASQELQFSGTNVSKVRQLDLPTEIFEQCKKASDYDFYDFIFDHGFQIEGVAKVTGSAGYVLDHGSTDEYVTPGHYKQTNNLIKDMSFLVTTGDIRTFWSIPCGSDLSVGNEKFVLQMDEPATVHVGLKQRHRQPHPTVTVNPNNINSQFEAVSALRAQLRTVLPKRSQYHQRDALISIEYGEETRIPDSLEYAVEDTGVTVYCPPDVSYLYAIAPFAAYNNAVVVQDSSPSIVINESWKYPLPETLDAFVEECHRLLKQTLTIDSYLNTYIDNCAPDHVQRFFESFVDTAPELLYMRSFEERLKTYLSISSHNIDEFYLPWRRQNSLPPTPQSLCALPVIVAKSGLIDTATTNIPSISR